mgnify:CR=1 FL=1
MTWSPADLAHIRRNAARAGMSMAEFVRWAVLKEADKTQWGSGAKTHEHQLWMRVQVACASCSPGATADGPIDHFDHDSFSMYGVAHAADCAWLAEMRTQK